MLKWTPSFPAEETKPEIEVFRAFFYAYGFSHCQVIQYDEVIAVHFIFNLFLRQEAGKPIYSEHGAVLITAWQSNPKIV